MLQGNVQILYEWTPEGGRTREILSSNHRHTTVIYVSLHVGARTE